MHDLLRQLIVCIYVVALPKNSSIVLSQIYKTNKIKACTVSVFNLRLFM